MIVLENWRRAPARVPDFRPSWGDLAAAIILDQIEADTYQPVQNLTTYNVFRR